ncbi:MAG TPA: glycosyltransferase family 2 protein [Polyangiales bacterium]|nr:glycosyltransferase family 2 protein [Polyangiales bacterium]
MPGQPTLSLIIPVYNEAQHLESWCQQILARDFGVSVEFVFVDDCSSDGSYDILQRFSSDSRVRLLRQEQNQGKGAALSRGIAESTGQIVLMQDADYEYSLDDVAAVIEPILRDQADIVFGSRYKNSQTVHRTFHYVVNRVLTLLSNLASGLYLTDMETCYKAFRGEIIRGILIESPRFGFEPEITAKVALLKARVAEVPIRYFPRNYLEGKKIKWTDGVAALWHIARFNVAQTRSQRALQRVPEKYRITTKQWL